VLSRLFIKLHGIHGILYPHSVEKDLSEAGIFVIPSISTSEVNVGKLYIEKSAVENIHNPQQRSFYSRTSVFMITKTDDAATIDR